MRATRLLPDECTAPSNDRDNGWIVGYRTNVSGTDAVNPNIAARPNMSPANDDADGRPRRRRMEIFAFLFLTAVLMPAFAVAAVGSYGLAVWTYQIIVGPPGPPAK